MRESGRLYVTITIAGRCMSLTTNYKKFNVSEFLRQVKIKAFFLHFDSAVLPFHYSIFPVNRQHVSYADTTPLFQLRSVTELSISFFFNILLYRERVVHLFQFKNGILKNDSQGCIHYPKKVSWYPSHRARQKNKRNLIYRIVIRFF